MVGGAVAYSAATPEPDVRVSRHPALQNKIQSSPSRVEILGRLDTLLFRTGRPGLARVPPILFQSARIVLYSV
jgi:hypothetical protein